jgi:hypothetical protein
MIEAWSKRAIWHPVQTESDNFAFRLRVLPYITHSRRFMRENEEEDENRNSKPEDEELFEDTR